MKYIEKEFFKSFSKEELERILEELDDFIDNGTTAQITLEYDKIKMIKKYIDVLESLRILADGDLAEVRKYYNQLRKSFRGQAKEVWDVGNANQKALKFLEEKDTLTKEEIEKLRTILDI